MNPLKWEKQEKYAALILMAVGANFGVLLGYFVHTVAFGAGGSSSLISWLNNFIYYRIYLWVIYGAAIAFALIYSKKLGV